MDNKLLCTEGELWIQETKTGTNGHSNIYHIMTGELGEANEIATLYSAMSGIKDQQKANAERIVTAWNCHDELVNALKDVLGLGKTKDGKFTLITSSQQAAQFKEILEKATQTNKP